MRKYRSGMYCVFKNLTRFHKLSGNPGSPSSPGFPKEDLMVVLQVPACSAPDSGYKLVVFQNQLTSPCL